ncbi:hypothetical protein HYT92_03560 [Candidatus Pacearchaeota archaeon]|nr:hypothetical protein [Candidatus Pacearchaeota archaeon]
MEKIGRAYEFFDCKASKEEIESVLPFIRERVRTPSKLEISLKEVKELQRDKETDPDLLYFIGKNKIYPAFPSRFKAEMRNAKPIKMTDLRYAIEAAYPDATNEETANRLGDVMEGIYFKYGNNMPFNVAVVAKIGGEYMFKE